MLGLLPTAKEAVVEKTKGLVREGRSFSFFVAPGEPKFLAQCLSIIITATSIKHNQNSRVMRKPIFIAASVIACGAMAAFSAKAQSTYIVEEESISQIPLVNCKTNYAVNGCSNWFIQLGAGISVPFFENHKTSGEAKRHITATYTGAFGRQFSPYMAFRLSAYGGAWHWDNQSFSKAKFVNANLDFMWDMCNSLWGVNSDRIFSIVPFVGLGGTYVWGIESAGTNVSRKGESVHRSWAMPVSAGLQLRLRLCSYCDLFFEGRAAFYGDNVNGAAINAPIDVTLQATGGLTFNIGPTKYKAYSPCKDQVYISSLNNQINNLRGELAVTAAALAAAQSQLPCPPTTQTNITEIAPAPLMSTVRFTINSAKISDEEMVNVYNTAQYLTENPDINVIIVGYADKATGTENYNLGLSERRAQAVYDALTNIYGINPDRLAIDAQGSSTQLYPNNNNWNRIVIFVPGF
jgi:outer membrane protein OmpA-like peptidoglycan-associated protein